MDLEGRCVGPPRARRQLAIPVGVEREMPGRIEGKGDAREPMGLAIVGAFGEPACEDAKVGRAVAATAAPLVERRDRPQELREWRLAPGRATAPPAMPHGRCGRTSRAGPPSARARLAGSAPATSARSWASPGAASRASRSATCCSIASMHRLQGEDEPGDCVGAADQIADEALEVIDQPALVARHCSRLGLLQLDAARHAGHEGLCVFRQALEDAYQVPQRLVDLGGVRLGHVAQHLQRLQPACDVFERHGLQFGAAMQGLHEDRQRRLHGFSALREPIEETCAVEVAEARDAGGVGMRFEVAPVDELGEGCIDLLDARRVVRPAGFGEDLVGPQLQAVLPLRQGEDVHDAAVKGRLLRAHMPKKIGQLAHGLHGNRPPMEQKGNMADADARRKPEMSMNTSRIPPCAKRGEVARHRAGGVMGYKHRCRPIAAAPTP